MSRLSEMIKELCPDGVEYKKLGEVCNLVAGGDVPKNRFSEHITDEYNVPVYSNGVEEKSLYGYTDIPAITEPCVTISARGTIGYAALRITPFFPVIRLICVIPDESINVRFLFHVLKMSTFRSPQTGIPQLTIPMVKKHLVPVPPLAIQNEIVKLLDNFTELTAELTAELQLRKKQYSFYRDSLLNFSRDDAEIEWRTLGDIGSVCMCKRILKQQTNTESGVPFYKIGTFGQVADSYISKELFLEYKGKYSYPRKGEILISAAGTIGRTVVYDGAPAYFQDSNIVWIANDESLVLNRYLYYFYSLFPWRIADGGTIARLYNDQIRHTEIPIPPLETQAKIVSILDRFDALCHDLTQGLPAEIAARKKQYEYYRDKLLTFPSKGA